MYDILDYLEAKSIKEVIEFVTSKENSKIIAGGTDVLIKCREGKSGYTSLNLVGVTRIPELRKIEETADGIFIGAACTFTEVENSEIVTKNIKILATAAGTVGGPQVRNAGTIGGNVANGATSADTASSLFALDAIIVIENATGRREVAIKDFYISAGKVVLERGDVFVGIKILKENYVGYNGHYIKFAQRNAMDIATLGCAALVKADGNTIVDLKLAFGVAGPTPLRATLAEEMAKGMEINDENLVKIGNKALESSNARTSWRGSKEFRENLIVELSQRAIKIATGKETK